MQSTKTGFRDSAASIIAIFLLIGLFESVFIFLSLGDVLVPRGAVAASFLARAYAIYLFAGTLCLLITKLTFPFLRKFRPFKNSDSLISVLSIVIAVVTVAYAYDFVLEKYISNILSRLDILLLLVGALLLIWFVISYVSKFVLDWIFRVEILRRVLNVTTLYRFQAGVLIAYLVAGLWMTANSTGTEIASNTDRPNIWLISVDTLRADRLSSYGYNKISTPAMDKLAADGVLFKNAYSPDHWTLPAHASLFTSLSPDVHGVTDWVTENFVSALPKAMQTVAELVTDAGYTSIATVDSDRLGLVGAARNFDQGFEYYGHYPIIVSPHQHLLFMRVFDRFIQPFKREHTSSMVSSIIEWLGDKPVAPYFFFLHLYDAHAESDNELQFPRYPYYPYRPCIDQLMPNWESVEPPVLNGLQGEAYLNEVNRLSAESRSSARSAPYAGPTKDDITLLSSLYDCGITMVDKQLGRLFDHLRETGQYDNSVIIVLSDHGEAFYEHRELNHWNLYDELVRVPLIIKPAGSRNRNQRQSERVTLLDVAPTILDYAGSPRFDIAEGTSLAPLMSGELSPDQVAVKFDRRLASGSKASHNHLSLRYGDYKIIRGVFQDDSNKLEIFNIEQDQSEKIDLADSNDEVRTQYIEILEDEIRKLRKVAAILKENTGPQDRRIEFTDKMKDDLKALGYVE